MNITSSRADLQNFANMVAFSIKRTKYSRVIVRSGLLFTKL